MKVLNELAARPSDPGFVQVYDLGPFRMDVDRREVSRNGEVVSLTSKAFDTLLVLVRYRSRVVEKDELVKLVWPDSFVSDDSLTQIISVLRRALGDDSNQPAFIATVPRRGYRFIATVTETPRKSDVEAATSRSSLEAPIEVGADGFSEPQPEMTRSPSAPAWRRNWVAVLITTSAVAALAVVAVARRGTFGPPLSPVAGPIRFTVMTPEGAMLASGPVLSPDGRRLVFVAEDRVGKNQLWVRDLDSAESQTVPGTEGAYRPFWSPDSRFVGFFADNKLKRVGFAGDPPQTIATVGSTPAGGSWSVSGLILFANRRSGLFSVAALGGPVTPVTTLDPSAKESAHRMPHFLPDGRHFLFFVVGQDPQRAGTYVGSLSSPERLRLLDESNSAAIYAPPGYLIYVRDRAIMAQRFDVTRLQLTGAPVIVAGHVSPPHQATGAVISAAAGGLLAYGGGGNAGHLIWYSRSGRQLGITDTPTALHNPTLSLDQRRLLAQSLEGQQAGLWVIDLDSGVAPARVVDGGNVPVWAPDGVHLVFTSGRLAGVDDIYLRSVVGRNEDTLLLHTAETKKVYDWSADGRYLVFTSWNPRSNLDLWLLPTFGDRKPMPFLQTPFNEKQGQVSPDGRWMAYASDESGRWEVYVQSFPMPGGKRAVSIGGGDQPRWRRDGRELFYLAADHTLMAVDVRPGATWQAARPRALFQVRLSQMSASFSSHYAVTADGQRFLVDAVDERESAEPMTVLVNWTSAIK